MDAETALRRNDRYLHEFVEGFEVCPFARNCRERGRLHRIVIAGDEPALMQAVIAHVQRLLEPELAHVEVGLVLVPDYGPDARAFDAMARRIGEKLGRQPPFHVVAFHPQNPGRDDDPWRLVGVLRRSPDPTLQLVRASVLDALRGTASEDTRYVAPEDLKHLAGTVPVRSLSAKIAYANFMTWQRHGKAMAALLVELAKPEK